MKILSKIFLSVVAIFFATTDFTFAQSFYNTPNDSIFQVGIMEDLHTLSIQQINITSDTIYLKWQKVSENMPIGWEAAVCDNFNCNTSLIDSGTMNPIIPNEYGLILLHITPHTNYGTAIIQYAVWDISTPSEIDTLTYTLAVNPPSPINEVKEENRFDIFPNPANEIIFIRSDIGSKFLITNNLGKSIQYGISDTELTKISTENLPDGLYNITIFNKNKTYTTTKFIIQH